MYTLNSLSLTNLVFLNYRRFMGSYSAKNSTGAPRAPKTFIKLQLKIEWPLQSEMTISSYNSYIYCWIETFSRKKIKLNFRRFLKFPLIPKAPTGLYIYHLLMYWTVIGGNVIGCLGSQISCPSFNSVTTLLQSSDSLFDSLFDILDTLQREIVNT